MSTFGFQCSPIKALLVILFLTICTYLGALWAPFFWDDDVLIRDNTHIRTLEEPSRFFLNPFWELVSAEHKERDKPNRHIMYRPLVMLSFAADYKIYGTWAPGFHLTNLILHLIVVTLVYSLALIILPKKDCEIAGVATCLFALHPALTQTVTWVSGRSDLLCALFVLFGILAYRQCEKNDRTYLGLFLAFLSMFMGLLTKEVAIVFPFLLLLTYTRPLADKGRMLNLALSLFPALLFYGMLKRAAASGSPLWDYSQPLSVHLGLFVKGATTFFRYLLRWLHPFNLRLSYPELAKPEFSYGTFDVLLFFLLFGLILRALLSHESQHCHSIALFWFILPLAPVANLFLFRGLWTQYAERYLYLPATFLFLSPLCLLGQWLHQREQWRAIVGKGLLAIIVIFGLLTMQRNALFQEPHLLWQAELAAFAENQEAMANLAITLCRMGRPEQGLVHLRRLCELNPKNTLAWNNRLMAAVDSGQEEEARTAFVKLRQLVPQAVMPALNYCLLLIRLGEFSQGRELMEEVLAKQPENGRALKQLAICLLEEKRPKEARKVLLRLLTLYPEDKDARKLVAATGAPLTH